MFKFVMTVQSYSNFFDLYAAQIIRCKAWVYTAPKLHGILHSVVDMVTQKIANAQVHPLLSEAFAPKCSKHTSQQIYCQTFVTVCRTHDNLTLNNELLQETGEAVTLC